MTPWFRRWRSGSRSVVIGRDNYAPILTGDHAQAVHVRLRPMAEIDAPQGLDHNFPHRRPLVGRTSELARLDQALAGPGGTVIQAVHGLGGVGKSALAIHWATTRAHGHAPVRWIDAGTPESIQRDLSLLAIELQPALRQAALGDDELVTQALQWLATHNGWLLILDNVDRTQDIEPLLARAPNGRFLITSRLTTGWPQAAVIIRLDVLGETESLALLTSHACACGPRNMDGAAELCAELGHLPLALEQAGSYLAQTPGLTPRGYLDLLARYPAAMFDEPAVTPSEVTVARVWRLTLDAIARKRPLTTHLLRVLAWYAPDRIPTSLLRRAGTPPAVDSALGLLTAFSMVTADHATGTLSVHRLVQALARTPDAPGIHPVRGQEPDPHRKPHLIDQARNDATTLLRNALPPTSQDPADWPAWQSLLIHVDAIADRSPCDHDTHDTAALLAQTGQFLCEQGQSAHAIRHLVRATTTAQRVLGKDHPDTLTSRNNLAIAYQEAGDLGRAIPLHEQTLAGRQRVQREDHPDTLMSRHNLASAYQEAGDLGRAIPLLEQTLKANIRALGKDHRQTLASCHNLACAYRSAGDLDRAIPLLEQTLKASMRALGKDHPQTLTSRHNLAFANELAGNLERAILAYQQVLADRQRVLGEDHPDTLTSRNNLATAYRSTGDLGQAIPLHKQTLTDRQRVLGEDHPDTLMSRHNLASAYESAGDLERAIPLHEQTLTDRQRVLGEDHPDTLTSRSDIACAYESAGDLERAIPLHEQTLTDRQRVLGEDHPDTLTSGNNLACAYQSAGDLERAIPLHEQTLEAKSRVLGENHPHTLASRNNLAYAYESAGDLGRAIPLLEQTLEANTLVLGENHPDTLASRNNMACAYQSAGDPERAVPLHEQALAGRQRVLGEDHPDTLTSLHNLACAYHEAGDLGRAIPLHERALKASMRVLGENHPHTLIFRSYLASAYQKDRRFGPGDPAA